MARWSSRFLCDTKSPFVQKTRPVERNLCLYRVQARLPKSREWSGRYVQHRMQCPRRRALSNMSWQEDW